MAVLGAQLVVTIVTISIIQKLSPHFSFAKYILCSTGLKRYLHPTDDTLRAKAGIPKERPQKSGGANKNHRSERNGVGEHGSKGQFHIPRNIEVELETRPVEAQDVVHLRYFLEYQWLLDFSVYAALVYVFSEIYHYYVPLKNEVNLSMLWCLLVVFFAVKLLSSLTVLYFQSEESIGERSMVIIACLVYLLIAMMIMIVDERILETGLEEAYTSFNQSASEFLTEQGLPSSGPASKIVIKFFIAMASGVLGALFTFPGLRMAKMHWDSLKYYQGRKFLQLILNISFIMPFILVILWIRPISRNYLTERVFEGMEKPLLTAHSFETMRLLFVVVVVVIRFALMPVYLQAYLNLAYDRVMDLRKEAGRITNVEFQKKISSIFYYLCVVTLQFAAPLILCLYLTLMYKNLGGFSWTGLFRESVLQHECKAESNELLTSTKSTVASMIGGNVANALEDGFEGSAYASDRSIHDIGDTGNNEFNILESVQSIHEQFTGLKNVFSTEVYKGFLGFATWWSYFTLFATSSLGIIYQSYFNKA